MVSVADVPTQKRNRRFSGSPILRFSSITDGEYQDKMSFRSNTTSPASRNAALYMPQRQAR